MIEVVRVAVYALPLLATAAAVVYLLPLWRYVPRHRAV